MKRKYILVKGQYLTCEDFDIIYRAYVQLKNVDQTLRVVNTLMQECVEVIAEGAYSSDSFFCNG
ncbi:MAG: hypothetical protein HWE34_00820 [Methylocystaceae bacterium]|nr:hypothetical protein [Methylocystaceae bacterium]